MTHERAATLVGQVKSRIVESANRTSSAFRENAGALSVTLNGSRILQGRRKGEARLSLSFTSHNGCSALPVNGLVLA
jgi:hypothetical protein